MEEKINQLIEENQELKKRVAKLEQSIKKYDRQMKRHRVDHKADFAENHKDLMSIT